MRRSITRSIAARIQRVAELHPDSEFIKGEITTTGLGVHLRWEYPDAVTPVTAPYVAEPSLVAVAHSESPIPNITARAPLSAASSTWSLVSGRTPVSSDEENQGADSRPQTPERDGLYDPGSVVLTPTAHPQRLRRDRQHVGTQAYPWEGPFSGIEESVSFHDAIAEQRKIEHRIHLEQVAKLEAWRRVKEQRWAEAEAAGVFDEDDEDNDEDDDEDGELESRRNEVPESKRRCFSDGDAPMSELIPSEWSRSSLARSDTYFCLSQEPPSRMGPTLSHPQLPYLRTPDVLSRRQSPSTSTTSTSKTTHLGSAASSASSSACSTSTASRSTRCVRHYQENGVWKTVGSFSDLPALAHLAAYNSLHSFDDPPLRQSDPFVRQTNRLPVSAGDEHPVDWPASLSRRTTCADIEAATRKSVGLTCRLHHSS